MADTYREIAARADQIVSPVFQNGAFVFPDVNTAAEAKQLVAQMVQMQKVLRLLKTEVTNQMKSIRASHAHRRANTQPSGMFGLFFGKGRAKHVSASVKNADRQAELHQLEPYVQGLAHIDRLLVNLDGAKVQINQWAMDPNNPRK
jgi:hypothetical protein